MGKEILEKLCKEYMVFISENPGVLAVTESADLLLSRETVKIQEDGRLKVRYEKQRNKMLWGSDTPKTAETLKRGE